MDLGPYFCYSTTVSSDQEELGSMSSPTQHTGVQMYSRQPHYLPYKLGFIVCLQGVNINAQTLFIRIPACA